MELTIEEIDSTVELVTDLIVELSDSLKHPKKATRIYEILLKVDAEAGRRMDKSNQEDRSNAQS